MENIEFKIEKILDQIRPYLAKDNGNIEFVRYEAEFKTAVFRFLKMCSNCPLQMYTLRGLLEVRVLKEIKEIKRIIHSYPFHNEC